jgi:hypothetical protein
MTTLTGAMSTNATGSGAAGYVLVHPLFLVTKIMIISIIYMFMSLGSHVHISEATNLFLIFFWIKLILELPKFLTIQKLDFRQFSLSGFAAALKPNQFDGKNFMIWRTRMELWLTVMNCYHAA